MAADPLSSSLALVFAFLAILLQACWSLTKKKRFAWSIGSKIPGSLAAKVLPLALGTLASAYSAEKTMAGAGLAEGPFHAVLLEETSETSANVSIGDVNGDGNLDILLVKGRHWPLLNQLLIGKGDGDFLPARPLGDLPDRSYTGVFADIDIDGDLDVIVSNDSPDLNYVYFNEGSGAFSARSNFGNPKWSTRMIAVADMNNDGWPDIIVANRSGEQGYNYVCFNRGEGRFDGDCLGFSSEPSTTITPADFNSDGFLDLAVPHRNGGQSYLYLNDGKGGFGRRVAFGPADASIRTAHAADFDEDGILDLAVIDERAGTSVLLGKPDLAFGDAEKLGKPGLRPYALAIADLDQDGHADVIVGHVRDRPVVYFGDGRGRFSPQPFGDDRGSAYGFAVGDLNQDGRLDIAMARSGAPNVLYLGRGQ